jgi:hypothetical protein
MGQIRLRRSTIKDEKVGIKIIRRFMRRNMMNKNERNYRMGRIREKNGVTG